VRTVGVGWGRHTVVTRVSVGIDNRTVSVVQVYVLSCDDMKTKPMMVCKELRAHMAPRLVVSRIDGNRRLLRCREAVNQRLYHYRAPSQSDILVALLESWLW
jgi:hypothetical protein